MDSQSAPWIEIIVLAGFAYIAARLLSTPQTTITFDRDSRRVAIERRRVVGHTHLDDVDYVVRRLDEPAVGPPIPAAGAGGQDEGRRHRSTEGSCATMAAPLCNKSLIRTD